MAYNTKKYLDEEGLKQVVRLLDEYPDNQILGTVIDEIQGELDKKADVVDIPEVPVQDVQVAGSSVVGSNGVANIPIAEYNSPGLLKTQNLSGLLINANNDLVVNYANSTDVKAGGSTYKSISPINQHRSVFFGLAKAAGDSTQSQSANEVGTYTPEAKGAIQKMLGVSDLIATEENNLIASKAYAVGDVFTANGKLYKVTAAIAVDGAIITDGANANCEETNVGEGFVKKTDIATAELAGIVKVDNRGGIDINPTTNKIYMKQANEAEIQAGAVNYRAIVPQTQYRAVFYGLAKAAGDTTQSASSNAVGVYTDSAKIAIKNMLGITHTLTVTVLTQDNVTVTGQTVTVRANSANGEIYATAAYEGQPVSFSVPDGFSYYVSVSDTLDHHFNPTTASGIVTNTDISVTLQYSDFSTIRTARDIKAALNAGLDLTDLVGEQITCSKGDDTLKWDVADYDSTTGKIKLLLHDAFGTANMVFEPAQALMWCENGLAAGSYTFTWNTTQCYFTLTTAIPAGGQLRATNTQFQTYASQSATATLETGTVSTDEIAGATDLGHEGQGLLNHRDRVNSGSNNFAESALFGWLNSDAAANTPRVPVTKFSRAYSYAQPGFMNGLDPDFVNCLDVVDWLCSTNNVYECPESLGGYTKGVRQAYTVKAKFGLASEMEIFGSYGGNPDGSTVFDLYNGADADDRKKYRGTSAQVWWLRSPNWYYAFRERYVSSSGSVSYDYAIYSFAVVPACQISRDTEVTE